MYIAQLVEDIPLSYAECFFFCTGKNISGAIQESRVRELFLNRMLLQESQV